MSNFKQYLIVKTAVQVAVATAAMVFFLTPYTYTSWTVVR